MGTIGPIACAALAADFGEWSGRVKNMKHDAFQEFFDTMKAMFEYASDEGAAWIQSY